MASAKVLVSDKLSEAGLKVLQEAPGIDVDYRPGLSEQELCDAIGEYHGLVIRSGSKVTANVLESADNLRVIGRAGIGVDNVDVPAASKRGIVVMNTPTGNTVTTAEHAISLLCALARKIPQACASTRGGKWEKNKFQGWELANKNLGVIGLGNIGRIVAERARGLQMNVLGVDPFLSPDRAAQLGVELVDLDDLLARADFITLHTPLTDDTRGLFDDAAFAKMKNGVLLVNAARGGIVDEQALVRAIESGKVAGAAMDVFEKEPIDPAHPLLKLDQVICTPHLGASTAEAQERVAVEISEQVVAYLKSGVVRNAVNVPAVSKEVAERLGPYLEVAHKLGRLVSQLEAVEVREFRVTCTGEAGELGVTPIAYSALAGFFEGHVEGPVNPVSAPYEAESRGIRVVEVREPASRGWSSSVRLTITGDKGIHTATGSLGIKGEPRLVGLEGYEVDAPMTGTTLVMRNQDRPGVIGAVGTLLGDRQINVSHMQVSLEESTGQALALYSADSDIPDDALDELRKLDNVSSVLSVKL
jgi:D-3-phosphoglycerate dehydrogenase / 2-oxoglutarate reductase